MSVNFVHLAGCATFNIVGHKVLHGWPPVIQLDELDGFGNPRVPSGFERVKMVKYSPPKIIVFHNNEGIIFPEVV
jgi:hypothetical protein